MEEQFLTNKMSDLKLTEELEYRLLNAWPSLECQFYRGWVARFANGYTKRANSAAPLWQGAELDGALIDHIVDQFRLMRVRPTFRLTGLEQQGTDALLAERGFAEYQPSYCMIHDDLSQFEAEDSITINTDLPEQWLHDAVRSQEEGSVSVLRDIVSRIRQPHGFATLVMDDQPVAWGLGVVERGFVGLYDIVVQPELRGLGLGRRVMSGLIAWGRERDARQAYLQVREDNEVARSLYASIGFRDAYRYYFRVLGEENLAQPEDNRPDFDWNMPITG